MTRLAVLADIHANLPALEAVCADMAPFEVDHVVVAGDVVNWGPFSAEVFDFVTRAGWAVIRGNNEYYLLDYRTPRAPDHWRAYSLLPWLREQLDGDRHRRIACWPDSISLRFPDAPPVRMVHGIPDNPWVAIFPITPPDEVSDYLRGMEENTLIAAHSHIALDMRVNGKHIINPGSVGVPLDGKFSASYAILDGDESGWRAQIRRVPFDYDRLYDAFEQQQFVARYGPIAELVIEEYRTARIQVYAFNLWLAEQHPGAAPTMALVDEFRNSDWERYMPVAYRREHLP